jgi:hypothetical protein
MLSLETLGEFYASGGEEGVEIDDTPFLLIPLKRALFVVSFRFVDFLNKYLSFTLLLLPLVSLTKSEIFCK